MDAPDNGYPWLMYVTLIEVQPLPGCFLDSAEVNGAFVRCYIPVDTEKLARIALQESLIDERLRLVQVEWIHPMDEVDWENPEDPTAAAHEAEARATGGVVYGEFHTWAHDANDAT